MSLVTSERVQSEMMTAFATQDLARLRELKNSNYNMTSDDICQLFSCNFATTQPHTFTEMVKVLIEHYPLEQYINDTFTVSGTRWLTLLDVCVSENWILLFDYLLERDPSVWIPMERIIAYDRISMLRRAIPLYTETSDWWLLSSAVYHDSINVLAFQYERMIAYPMWKLEDYTMRSLTMAIEFGSLESIDFLCATIITHEWRVQDTIMLMYALERPRSRTTMAQIMYVYLHTNPDLIISYFWALAVGGRRELVEIIYPFIASIEDVHATVVQTWHMETKKAIVDGPTNLYLKTHIENLPLWRGVVQWMLKVRPYAWHWYENHQRIICDENGNGRQNDKNEFEAFMGEL